MKAPSRSMRVRLASVAMVAFCAGCSSGETTSGGGAGSASGGETATGGGGNTSGGAGGQTTGGGGSTASGGSAAAGGAGAGAAGMGGSNAGSGAGGSAGACSPSLPVCPAKGSNAADNCRMGTTCCNGTGQLTCVCAAETCTFYFGI